VSAKLGFDATVPMSAEPFDFTRIRVPGEDTVDLSEWLAEDPLARLESVLGS